MTMNGCLPVEYPDVLAQTVRCWNSAYTTPVPADLNGSSPSDPTKTPYYLATRDPLQPATPHWYVLNCGTFPNFENKLKSLGHLGPAL
jgi:hypothetical protein